MVMYLRKTFLALLFVTGFEAFAQQTPDKLTAEIMENLKEQASNEFNVENSKIEVTQSLNKNTTTLDENNSDFKIFGLDFFNFRSQTNTPVLDIPLLSDYVISFNDELELLLTGTNNKIINLRVDLGGSVLIPDLGRVSLQGLTINDANIKIQNLINNAYISTNSFLNVKNPSLKKISVIGSVKEPGTFLVNPYISLSEAIKYAGGLNKNASLRKILVKDIYGNVTEHDMYEFLVFGDRKVDVNLQNGDTVIISATSNHVNIDGEVQRPMVYEYHEDDSFRNLIDFSLGLTSSSNIENISVNKSEEGVIKTYKVNMSKVIGKDNILDVYVGKKELDQDKLLFVNGNGVDDGYFAYSKAQNLSEIITNLKFSSSVYPFYSVLKQESEDGRKIEFKYFSLFDKNSYESIVLKNNPELKFFSKNDVLKMGESLIKSSLTNNTEIESELKDYLKQSDLKLVTIGNRSMKLPLVADIAPIDLYNYLGIPGQIIQKDVTVNLENESISDSLTTKFSTNSLSGISFPEKENNTISVSITGQIANPGTYIVTTGTSLDDLYNIAGGLQDKASVYGIFFSRESIKKKEREALESSKNILADALVSKATNDMATNTNSINLTSLIQLANEVTLKGRITGNFAPDSEESKSFFLEDNDEIFIPYKLTTVTIVGEILNQVTTKYRQDMSYSDYIKSAGGMTKYADKNSIYVIRANGESMPLGNRIFQKPIYPEPGDTIVIPRDLDKLDTLPLISVATRIISDIAFSAASLNAIRN